MIFLLDILELKNYNVKLTILENYDIMLVTHPNPPDSQYTHSPLLC